MTGGHVKAGTLSCILIVVLLLSLAAFANGWHLSYSRPRTFWLCNIESGWSVLIVKRGSVIFAYSADGLPALAASNDQESLVDRQIRASVLRQLPIIGSWGKEAGSDRAIKSIIGMLNTLRQDELKSLQRGIGSRAIFGFFVRAATSPAKMITLCIPLWALTGASLAALVLVGWRRLAWLRRRYLLRGVCTECGYNLFGLASSRCPECGTPIPEEQKQLLAKKASA